MYKIIRSMKDIFAINRIIDVKMISGGPIMELQIEMKRRPILHLNPDNLTKKCENPF